MKSQYFFIYRERPSSIVKLFADTEWRRAVALKDSASTQLTHFFLGADTKFLKTVAGKKFKKKKYFSPQKMICLFQQTCYLFVALSSKSRDYCKWFRNHNNLFLLAVYAASQFFLEMGL